MAYLYVEAIQDLCIRHTDLTDQDITYLKMVMQSILEDTSNADKDVFIDVRDRVTGEGLVVFHRYPLNGPSNYKRTVVGELAFRKDEPGALRTLDTGRRSNGLLAQTQEGKIIEQDVLPIRSQGRVIGVIIAEQDIGSQIIDTFDLGLASSSIDLLKDVLSEASSIESSVTNYLNEAVFIFNASGDLIYSNQAARNKYQDFGYRNRLDQLHYNNITLDIASFDHVKEEFVAKDLNRLEKIVHINQQAYLQKTIRLEENDLYLLVLTELESQAPSAKGTLIDTVEIQEIHHRVKNSLQSVVSILRLQARRAKSQEAKEVLTESVNRVMAIAATHELLSKQKESQVQIALVLQRVVSHLHRAYLDQKKVTILSDLDESIRLNSDIAVTIALIVNEMLQNSFEHAFEEEREEENTIQLSLQLAHQHIVLSVQDNGSGFEMGAVQDTSLGLQLIRAFTEDKLKGTCRFTSQPKQGTKIEVTFRPDESQRR